MVDPVHENYRTLEESRSEPVNGLKKLALVSSQFGGVEFATERRVLVDEPSLTQHVCCGVLQLHTHTHIRTHIHSSSESWNTSCIAKRTCLSTGLRYGLFDGQSVRVITSGGCFFCQQLSFRSRNNMKTSVNQLRHVGISIGSAVFVGLSNVINRQTDRQTHTLTHRQTDHATPSVAIARITTSIITVKGIHWWPILDDYLAAFSEV